jgi:hypothetical protein
MSEDRVGGHFVLLRGEPGSFGGSAIVRRGVDDRDGSAVAVKFIDSGKDELTRQLFRRETSSLRKLSHRNIVRLREAGIDETGTYFLVLDWVDNDLLKVIDKSIWSSWIELYTSMVRPLLDGLAYAHLNKLEHRDIKPGNILIDDEGQPLLADFGIAKLRGDAPHSEHTVQSHRSGVYAPPERESPIGYVRDVYSVGVVVLQCLTPTKISDYPDLKPALAALPVPEEVRALLSSCVSFDPSERPKNAIVLADRLKEIWQQSRSEALQRKNQLWLDFTRPALDQLALITGRSAINATQAIQADLAGQVHLEYGFNRESGERDRSWMLLYGSEYRYALTVLPTRRVTVNAVRDLPFEELDRGRKRALAVPPVIGWVPFKPANLQSSERAMEIVEQLLDQHYDAVDSPEAQPAGEGDHQFDLWLRVLDARADLARGDLQPLKYKSLRVEGRRARFELTQVPEVDLITTEWEVFDPANGWRFGNGEIVDQEGSVLTLLTGRPLSGLPKYGQLRPYDRPSATALNRQRAALVAIKGETVPNPSLKQLILNPALNAVPRRSAVNQWFTDLDDAKKVAVELALGTTEALVVEGPPGTGKTRFIVEAVSQYLRKHPDHRILIASQTHVAVDNAVERLHGSGLAGLVRLAGADDAAVAPAVRELLLDQQMPKWADQVRAAASANIESEAMALGVNVEHARAALVLEQFLAALAERARLAERMELMTAVTGEPSDLATAVDDEDPLEQLQARSEYLSERMAELVGQAGVLLAETLTIPAQLSETDAKNAIGAIVGTSDEARMLLDRLALQGEWMERIEADDGLMATFLAGSSVVAGTCIGLLRNRVVGQLEFDLCIVDEASRATLSETLVPMARAKSWILVGDTRQLPPSDADLTRKKELLAEHGVTEADVTETLFQRLVNHLPPTSQLLLDSQYRMVKQIGDLISTCFYDGRLRSTRTEGLTGYETFAGAPVLWIDTTPLGERRRQQGGEGMTSVANRAEVEVLCVQLEAIDSALALEVIERPSQPLEVLAIAPYRSQVEALQRKIATLHFRHLNVSVMSVDSVQGREADLAFFSVTRSNAEGKLGFLGPAYWRRINVALSRARFGLTIVGDASFIRESRGGLRTVLDYIEGHPFDCKVRGAST